MRTVARDKLAPWQEELLQAAERASRTANCPYSEYPVGSALRVRTRTGELVTVLGNNSETANYRSVCAEKHAVHRALADHSWTESGTLRRPEILAAAVYCAVGATPQQPCGDCRETLNEINPDIEIIAAAGPGRNGGAHDPRAKLSTVRALLPHGFQVESLRGEVGTDGAAIHEPESIEDYVVHLTKPGDLSADAGHRVELLRGTRYLILVGSPRRARKIAELAHQRFGALRDADASCYLDLTVPGRDESGREYAVYVPELPVTGDRTVKVAVASHGIGKAGVEILLSELPALIALTQDGQPPALRGVFRCGTRGTLTQVPLGCVALSTSTFNESLERIEPSAAWVEAIRRTARARGLRVIPDEEIDGIPGRADLSASDGASLLVEGPGISTSFFWQGQSRPLYRASAPENDEVRDFERRRRARRLALWVQNGVRWIEMEDYTVLRVAELCGLPAVTLGAVVGRRRRADGSFQGDYDKQALAVSELLPSELVLEAIRDHAAGES